MLVVFKGYTELHCQQNIKYDIICLHANDVSSPVFVPPLS